MTVDNHNSDGITLMLLGGGIRFSAFVGALQAIEEKGLKVKRIIGSSTGSIVGALYAAGMEPAQIQETAMALATERFKDFSPKNLLAGKGLYSGTALESWVDEKLEGKRFGDNFRLAPYVITTDVLNYRPLIFSPETFPDVKVSAAARYSIGVPLVFAYRHFNHGGKKHVLVDGTLMSGLVEEMYGKQDRTLILKVVSKRTLNHPSDGTLPMKKYFLEMLTIFMHAIEKEFIKGGKWKDTILLYCADISPARFSLTANEKSYLFDQGYEQTKKYLEYKWGI